MQRDKAIVIATGEIVTLHYSKERDGDVYYAILEDANRLFIPDELRIINEDGIIATEDNLWGVADEKFDNISVDELNIVNTYSGLLNERGVWLFEKENSNGAIEHD